VTYDVDDDDMDVIDLAEDWDPFFDYDEDFVDIPVVETPRPRRRKIVPKMNIFQAKDAMLLEMDLPGVTKDNFSVSFDAPTLTIKGTRKDEHRTQAEDPDQGYLMKECRTGRFRRRFTVPPEFDGTKATASINNGVLKVVLPRHQAKKGEAQDIPIVETAAATPPAAGAAEATAKPPETTPNEKKAEEESTKKGAEK